MSPGREQTPSCTLPLSIRATWRSPTSGPWGEAGMPRAGPCPLGHLRGEGCEQVSSREAGAGGVSAGSSLAGSLRSPQPAWPPPLAQVLPLRASCGAHRPQTQHSTSCPGTSAGSVQGHPGGCERGLAGRGSRGAGVTRVCGDVSLASCAGCVCNEPCVQGAVCVAGCMCRELCV